MSAPEIVAPNGAGSAAGAAPIRLLTRHWWGPCGRKQPIPAPSGGRRLHHDRHEARRSKQAKHCQNDNGQQVPAVNFQQLCQNAFGRFNSGVDAGFIRTGVIDVGVHDCIRVRLLHAVCVPIRARMGMRAHDPAGHHKQ